MGDVVKLRPFVDCHFNADVRMKARSEEEIDNILRFLKREYDIEIDIFIWDKGFDNL